MTRFRLLLALIALVAPNGLAGFAEEPVSLMIDPKAWAESVRVTARLRVAGEVTPEGEVESAAEPSPVTAQIELSYRQEALQSYASTGHRAMRRIDSLDSGSASSVVLRPDRRSLVVRAAAGGAIVAAAEGPLTRPELDLTQLPADPLDIHALLPGKPVRDGGSWKVEPAAVEALLRVQTDRICEVTAIVTGITKDHVKLRLAGPVHGRAEGAEFEIDLRGVALFDRRAGRISRLNLGWKESRRVGPATPALEARAKLNLEIQPLEKADRIAVTDLLLAETATIDERLEVTTGDRGWRLLADRDWFVVASGRHTTTLRRVTDDRVTATTTLTTAPRTAFDADAFEREVGYSLGDRLLRVVSSTRGRTATGSELFELASIGKIEGRPVSWRHTHVQGELAALTATTTLYADDADEDAASVRRLLASATAQPRTTNTAGAAAPAVRR